MRPRKLTFLFIIPIVFLVGSAFAQMPALQTALNLTSEQYEALVSEVTATNPSAAEDLPIVGEFYLQTNKTRASKMNFANFNTLAITLLCCSSLFAQNPETIASFSADAGLYEPDKSPLNKTNSDGTVGFSWLSGHPDLKVLVSKVQACPSRYTLSISNGNLFDPAEQALLDKFWRKCRFANTNITEKVRDASGDGYDASFFSGGTSVINKLDSSAKVEDSNQKRTALTTRWERQISVQVVKHGQLNGIRVDFYGEHGGCLLHFHNDKAIGEWFDWDPVGDLRFQAVFNKPYDLFGNLVMTR